MTTAICEPQRGGLIDAWTIVCIVIGAVLMLAVLKILSMTILKGPDGTCPTETLQTTVLDPARGIMADGSRWGVTYPEWKANHTYAYAHCYIRDGSCVCPRGSTHPYMIIDLTEQRVFNAEDE